MPRRAGTLAGIDRVRNGGTGIVFGTAVDSEARLDDEAQHDGELAAELARQFHGLVDYPLGFGELSAPNPVQHNLKVDEDQLTLFAPLDAPALIACMSV
jgi:hypothetical protein